MKTKNAQRAAAFTTVAIGSVLAVASSAFGCGAWVGKIMVTGNGPLVGTGESVSVGSGNGMFRCANAILRKDASIDAINNGTPTPGSVTVTVAPATSTDCASQTSQFRDGVYSVNILHERVRIETNFNDCMNGVALTGGGATGSGFGYPIGYIDINGGSGTKTFNDVVGPIDTGKSLLCVSDALGDHNNQVQVWFL